ncbi:MAG: hypothetical protein ACRC7O_03955 [Fimbriiglobus sp.]
MPSRFGVALIVGFWLATTGFVAYRDVYPRYFSDGPPPLRIDLADEATSQVPAKWSLFRHTADGKDEKIGGLTTFMQYVGRDDTFWFRSEYRDVKFQFGNIQLGLPVVDAAVRVTRAGHLREQTLEGKLEVVAGLFTLAADAKLDAIVKDNILTGKVKLVPAANPRGMALGGWSLERDLAPVSVTSGQVLNPMMPVGRLWDVRPGRRWVIREVDPLKDALGLLAQEAGKASPLPIGLPGGPTEPRELIAKVRSAPVPLVPYRPGPDKTPADPVDCWVIDYRATNDDLTASTWVSVADGRVLRQEASGFGERLRFEREY